MEGEAGKKLGVNGWHKIFSSAIFIDVLKTIFVHDGERPILRRI